MVTAIKLRKKTGNAGGQANGNVNEASALFI